MKSGNLNFLEPSEPLQACNGTDLPFYRTSLIRCYNYNQQYATVSDYLFLKGSTCFGRFFRLSSGALNCAFSFKYCQNICNGIAACSSNGWQYLKLNLQLCAPDDGRRNRPKHIQPLRNTYLFTPWCRVLLEKLTSLQLVKKFPAFHGTRRFITALTSVRHLSLSWASPIQSIYSHTTFWRSILILSTHLRLGLPSGLPSRNK